MALITPSVPSAGRGAPPPVATMLSEFAGDWWAGRMPRAEDWIARLEPGRSAEAVELIYQEYCLAESSGLAPDRDVYLARFPEHRAALERLLSLRSLGLLDDQDDGSPELPAAGDEIGPYTLIRELGRGAFARVFLAEQADLASRPVVVKVTTRPSPEPSRLARARHAHIIEVLHHAEVEDGALQIVCMPFLGGATLGAVTATGGRRPRSGADFLARLDRVSAPEYPPADVPRPAREILGRLSYAKAVAWIFARLAEALDHAHRRGVAHGDIKPSNILITADALPMLFDFNLSVDWREAEADSVGGGTLAYMPPERLLALALARIGVAIPGKRPDLHRADVYSLGLVLVESLTGIAPAVADSGDPADIARLREGGTTAFPDWANLSIPLGLRPILTMCLKADPTRRYADGRSLAEDLDRWRSDLPPITAPDARWPVPLVRWMRRTRIPIAALALTVLVAATAAGFTMSGFRSTFREKAVEKYDRLLDKEDLGFFAFRQHGAWSPAPGDPAEVAVRKLKPYDVLDNPDWRLRGDVASLPGTERNELELLMLEQVYRVTSAWADRPDSPGDWSRALRLLDRESRHARNPTFDALRATLRSRDKVTLADVQAPSRPATALVEDYLAGVAVEPTSAREALTLFGRASEARPGLLWPGYRAASAAYRIAKYETAARLLRIAANRRPDNAALHTQLASALLRAGRPQEALSAVDRAIVLDRDFAEAYRNRTMIDVELTLPDRDDVARFTVLKRLDGLAEVEKFSLQTLVRGLSGARQEGPSPADDLMRKILNVDPMNPDVRCLKATMLLNANRDALALAAFDQILDDRPDHLRARYGRVHALLKLRRPEAIEEAARLIREPRFEELYPEDHQAIFTFYHVSYDRVRANRLDEALEVAENALTHSRRNGIFEGRSLYHLAQVHAAASKSDPSRVEMARDRLDQAIALDPTVLGDYENDPIFADIRREPRMHPGPTQSASR